MERRETLMMKYKWIQYRILIAEKIIGSHLRSHLRTQRQTLRVNHQDAV